MAREENPCHQILNPETLNPEAWPALVGEEQNADSGATVTRLKDASLKSTISKTIDDIDEFLNRHLFNKQKGTDLSHNFKTSRFDPLDAGS